ncbi:MAG: group II intron reverse transcriptase domain-containing protein [Treponema sp.]|nr:group II intron reverse transcriptase domain-containing protein [Treponema sp.]
MSQTFFSKAFYCRICSIENLKEAYYKASRRKKSSNSFLYFRKNEEVNIQKIQEELLRGTWECGTYRQFKVFEPKERLITAAPFKDRIAHHAIINVLEPLFERQFIFHTYACRKGKGTHAAIRYAKTFCRKGMYFLKLDVRKYFDSIDHGILKERLYRLTNEGAVNDLFRKIIDSYTSPKAQELGVKKGIPIGNLTSQFFANLYLSDADHYILEVLRADGYVRYMDDMLVFSKDFGHLKNLHKKLAVYFGKNLDLELKTPVFGRCTDGIPFLGKLISRSGIKPLSEKRRLKAKKIKRIDRLVQKGAISQEKAAERINAILSDAQMK